jgi:hypothetical protein
MFPSPSSSTTETRDYAEELNALLAELAERPDREPVSSELEGNVQHLQLRFIDPR